MSAPPITRLAGTLVPAAHALRPRPCAPPLWRELLPPARRLDRPLASLSAPCPAPVLLIPGLFMPERSMDGVAGYLIGCGFDPRPCGLGRNVDCSEASIERLVPRLRAIVHDRGERAVVVGHSRGGVLARVLAARAPDLVCGVITLGSPYRDQLAVHPALWAVLLAMGTLGRCGVTGLVRYSCQTGECCRRFRRDLAADLPAGVGELSIYSRRDGVVDWQQCAHPSGERLEVGCTHRAMPEDPYVLGAVAAAIARFSAERSGQPAVSHPPRIGS